ncbi:unnamed protein product [Miscanthus lutarioriparius]|uniref:MATH domain-containing protein n=1 Tax=Miscanthus lutarioriparius TaxID=422564 RepID=A0A811PKZ4_9POAL|nr:unnamed protein product [Miscanthus lutarioriparius]
MAASQLRPPRVTASICSLEKESGEHTFDYSYQTDLDRGYILSDRFTVGGHDWRIRYYPDGTGNGEECKDYVGVQLELMSVFTKVRLAYEFSLVEDQAAFKSTTTVLTAENPTCGTDKFKKKSDLRRFLWNDSLKIHCVVTVIKEAQLRETAVSSYLVDVQVPPSTLSSDLGQLLASGKDADITRSRLKPALLHFIYTDSRLKEHRNEEIAKKLLAAADKYGMERMKLYCGRILSDRLTVHSVATTIALADDYHCRELKDACIQFILSSTKTGADVISIEGCEELELKYPGVVLEILEKSGRKKVFKKPVEKQQDPEERRSAGNHRGEGKFKLNHITLEHNLQY